GSAKSPARSGSGLFMRWIQWQTIGAVSRSNRAGTASVYRCACSGPISAQSASDGRPPRREAVEGVAVDERVAAGRDIWEVSAISLQLLVLNLSRRGGGVRLRADR